MDNIRIALIQTGWHGSREAMQTHYEPLIGEAAKGGAQLVCLQEFSLLPYFPGVRDEAGFGWAETLPGGPSESFFAEMARRFAVHLIGSLFEQTPDGDFFDTATLHSPEGLVGSTRKIHIPSGEGYHETDYFRGDVHYPVHGALGVNVATPTCYDQWFPELARIYTMNGAELIFYPTAIGAEPTEPDIDTAEQWQTVMRGHAIANGIFVAAANRIGEENGIPFYGSSFICDPMGQILAQASRDQTEVIMADLDPAILEKWRRLFPLLHQRRPETYQRILGSDVKDVHD